MVPHMLMQSLPVREALGMAASTHKKEVKMPLHMAEGSVGVLVNNSTVGTEGHLPSPALNVQRLPHQAPMSVEVHQQELPVHTSLEIRRHYSHQAGCSCTQEGRQSRQQVLHEAFLGVQQDPARPWGKLVRRALREEALLLENWQPMICYDLWLLSLSDCGSWSEPLGGVDVLLRWGSPSLQS